MSLAEFIEGEKADSNLWWRLSSGDHQNLLDEAIDRIAALATENERLRWIVAYLIADVPDDDGNQPGSCYQCCGGCGPSSWESLQDELSTERWELMDDDSDQEDVARLLREARDTVR
jgi:hypothetical protein